MCVCVCVCVCVCFSAPVSTSCPVCGPGLIGVTTGQALVTATEGIQGPDWTDGVGSGSSLLPTDGQVVVRTGGVKVVQIHTHTHKLI